jgi:hypothetical protein
MQAVRLAGVLLAGLVCAALAGCASVGESPVLRGEVPQSRRFDQQPPRPGDAVVEVQRNDRWTGSDCQVRISINGRPVADLERGEFVRAAVPAGSLLVSATYGHEGGICVFRRQTLVQQITLAQGEVRSFVYDISPRDSSHFFQPTVPLIGR